MSIFPFLHLGHHRGTRISSWPIEKDAKTPFVMCTWKSRSLTGELSSVLALTPWVRTGGVRSPISHVKVSPTKPVGLIRRWITDHQCLPQGLLGGNEWTGERMNEWMQVCWTACASIIHFSIIRKAVATPKWAALMCHIETSVTGPPTAYNKRLRARCPAGSALDRTGFSALEGNKAAGCRKGLW